MSTPPVIGTCIYCGTTEKPLKTEHIVPFGWGKAGSEGDVLLEASCGQCEDMTKGFEQYVMRELFGNIRKVMELRSRGGKLPKTIDQLIRDKSGVEKMISVPIDEAIDILFMPVFAPPGICEGNLAVLDCELVEIQLINVGINSSKSTYTATSTDEVHAKMQFKNKTFEKFLLKIAYCTAIKNYGYEVVKNSPIPKILMGFDKRYGTFLGCLEHNYLPKVTHKGTWMQYGSYDVSKGIVYAVQLFAVDEGSPEYHVVVIAN